MYHRSEVRLNPLNAILGLVFFVLTLMALFWLAKSIFAILAWLAPILIIATLIIDYRTIVQYGKWVLRQWKTSILQGILVTLLTIVGFPVISFVLFVKSLLVRKVRNLQDTYQQEQQTFQEYEIIEESPSRNTLELPPLEKSRKESSDEYRKLFE